MEKIISMMMKEVKAAIQNSQKEYHKAHENLKEMMEEHDKGEQSHQDKEELYKQFTLCILTMNDNIESRLRAIEGVMENVLMPLLEISPTCDNKKENIFFTNKTVTD